jgi:alpha-ribazole phosphatase
VEGAFSYAMVTKFEFKRDADGHYHGTFTKIHDGIQMAPLKIG